MVYGLNSRELEPEGSGTLTLFIYEQQIRIKCRKQYRWVYLIQLLNLGARRRFDRVRCGTSRLRSER